MEENNDLLPDIRMKNMGRMSDVITESEWSSIAQGDMKSWPGVMHVMVHTCLGSRSRMATLWGKDFVVICNEAFSRMAGMQHRGFTGVKAKELWDENWHEVEPLLQSVRKEGRSLLVKGELFRVNGKGGSEENCVTVACSPICNGDKMEGILLVATETRKAVVNHRPGSPADEKPIAETMQQKNEDLKRSEEQYHKMIAEIQDYVIILLNVKGDIENWNAGAEAIIGYAATEIIGKNFRIFYTKEERENEMPETLLHRAVKYGKAHHEGWRVRKDGSVFWSSITITALHTGDGSIFGFSKVMRDLTEKKHAEDIVQRYLAALEFKNGELEQFAYVASHDLQEPLRKIQVFNEMIEKNFPDEKICLKYLEKISSSVQRMAELIRSLLNYSSLSKKGEDMVSTDLNVVLAEVKADYELLIEEKHAVVKSSLLPVITATPLLVNQLFTNLIGNALKFTKTTPVIQVSSGMVSREQVVHNPSHLAGRNYMEICFADNGIGFDQQYEHLIFSMFQRLHGKQEFKGTGIGLALCKKIMEIHGGYITAKSEVNNGATFYLYFPV